MFAVPSEVEKGDRQVVDHALDMGFGAVPADRLICSSCALQRNVSRDLRLPKETS